MRTGFFRTSHDQRRRSSMASPSDGPPVSPGLHPRRSSVACVEGSNGHSLLKLPARSSLGGSPSRGPLGGTGSCPAPRRRSHDLRDPLVKNLNTNQSDIRPRTIVATVGIICGVFVLILLVALYLRRSQFSSPTT